MNTVYLQTYFVTIACILGTGILGLPVTLYKSGFYPFLVIFIIAFFMQTLVIFIAVEVLQKGHAVQVKYDKENQETPKNNENPLQNSSGTMSEIKSEMQCETKSLNSEIELLPLKEMLDEDTCDELEDQPENGGPVLAGHVILSKRRGIRSPDMHLLGEMFLYNGVRHFFDIIVVLLQLTMLVAYSLAGSEAYGEMLRIKYIYVIPVFTWCLAILIVFAINLIQPVVSILTFIKASLFTMAVIVTFFVTSEVQENVENDFNHILDSFLMCTVALGGTFIVMPFLFRKIEDDASQILKYRLAIVMGLVTCTILNILWCWVVVEIVPQHCLLVAGTNQSSNSPVTCNSLESANKNGQISTKPLTKIIHNKHPSFSWVAIVVEVFIIISITVSFMTIGTAMHHIICGIIESSFPTCFLSKYTPESKKNVDIGKKCASSFLSLILFGIVFLIAMLNPKGFLEVMEKFTSSSLNMMNILVFMMFICTRNKENKKVKIPLPLAKKVIPFVYLIPLYFGFAIAYDIYFSLMVFLDYETDKSHLTVISHLHNNSYLFNVTTSPANVTS